MFSLLFWNKNDIIITICLAIVSFYVLKKFMKRKSNHSEIIDDDDDDDIPFRSNIDRRSLRPSYARFMRRKLQEDLNHNPYLCVICWNERKNIVLLPCRHLCVCLSCSQQLWNNNRNETCPICRKEVENRLEVFV